MKFKPNPEYRLMDQVREVLRYYHYAYRTEQSYSFWILQYIKFYGGKTHPKDMGKNEVERFLSFLAEKKNVAAAMASARNSIGYEIDQSLKDTIYGIKSNIVSFSNQYVRNRIKKHIDFVAERIQSKGSLKYTNKFYGFPVITNQEKELIINDLTEV
ncbi:MAG: phage integrase N-terminal SAM-like domain-containing protein, partial [Deltaproteobacteria bacterium]|nr:phage integrase N-terminal SAM-like domain-containing protein [Deltaproteobacteria bacterium]